MWPAFDDISKLVSVASRQKIHAGQAQTTAWRRSDPWGTGRTASCLRMTGDLPRAPHTCPGGSRMHPMGQSVWAEFWCQGNVRVTGTGSWQVTWAGTCCNGSRGSMSALPLKELAEQGVRPGPQSPPPVLIILDQSLRLDTLPGPVGQRDGARDGPEAQKLQA